MKPILFTSENIKKISTKIKTQTRRVIKPQPENCLKNCGKQWLLKTATINDLIKKSSCKSEDSMLYIREPFWKPPDKLTDEIKKEPGTYPAIAYDILCDKYYREMLKKLGYKKLSPIFMPKRNARLYLDVKRIWIERIQDISDNDISCEGIEINQDTLFKYESSRKMFIELWDSINKKNGFDWSMNPFVYCVEFELWKAMYNGVLGK